MLIVSYNGADLVDCNGNINVADEWVSQLKQLDSLTRYWPRNAVALVFDPEMFGYHKCGAEWTKMMVIAANTLTNTGVTVIDCTDKIRKMVIDTQPDYHIADMYLTSKDLWWTPRFSASWEQLLGDLHNLVVSGGIPTWAKTDVHEEKATH